MIATSECVVFCIPSVYHLFANCTHTHYCYYLIIYKYVNILPRSFFFPPLSFFFFFFFFHCCTALHIRRERERERQCSFRSWEHSLSHTHIHVNSKYIKLIIVLPILLYIYFSLFRPVYIFGLSFFLTLFLFFFLSLLCFRDSQVTPLLSPSPLLSVSFVPTFIMAEAKDEYMPKCILLTGGAGFMYVLFHSRWLYRYMLFSLSSPSSTPVASNARNSTCCLCSPLSLSLPFSPSPSLPPLLSLPFSPSPSLPLPPSPSLPPPPSLSGSNVMIHLANKYPDVKIVCYDKLDYCSSPNNFAELKDRENFQFVHGDITSPDLVRHIIQREKIDTILNFAAQTHVDNSFGNSYQFTHTNVYGTHVLLESAKAFQDQIRLFVHVSTDEVYGESSHESGATFDEKSALNPTNPYAATKAAAEFIVKAYHISFGLPTIITRGNNVFGPRQYPEKLIPKFISLLERKKHLCVHGDGSNKRSFIYVDDVARAFDVIIRKGKVGNIYNIGTEREQTVLDVTHALLKQYDRYDKRDELIDHVGDRPFNDARYFIDLSKLATLGWEPKVSFDEGVKMTIKWYREHPDHWEDVESALVAHPRKGMAPSTAAGFGS
jgi:dTDP-glucose 4,6-dehydratase